ncbi:hypothetical protein [uncultured Methanobrevibacter sp.]|uniref:hypothetical protein n=1 Tax=uncultured Methanobrevibacter sp. TaxID=253161 RepID=UPI0025EEA13C|nr:hypothetical protein [uncultured Methanobrevibacter sp.]
MKSELYPGINFEHTLDDVLFVEYDQFLSEDYYVNIPYLLENLDILITLRDVVIPNNFIPLKEIRSAVGKRAAEDFNAKKFGIFPMSGIYEWEYRFSRDYHRTIDDMIEDDIRLALDIVKKYPEHKDLVIKRETE